METPQEELARLRKLEKEVRGLHQFWTKDCDSGRCIDTDMMWYFLSEIDTKLSRIIHTTK